MVARERAGTELFGPELVEAFAGLARAGPVCPADLDAVQPVEYVMSSGKAVPGTGSTDTRLDAALEAVADFVDVVVA